MQQNSLRSGQYLKVVYKYKTKLQRKPNSINVILELDPKAHKEIEGREVLYVGWRTCKFEDYINVVQCFRCWRFGHMARECKRGDQVCADCGGGHKNCGSEVKKCVNCKFASEVLKVPNVQYDHAAYDRKCVAYKRIYEQLQTKVKRLSVIDTGAA